MHTQTDVRTGSILGNQACAGFKNRSNQPDYYIYIAVKKLYNSNLQADLRVNLYANPGNNSKVDLGTRQNAAIMFIAGYSLTTIQHLLKKEDIVVMRIVYHPTK